ncbi:uncharacterized protein V1516DRAFT_3013 [Lipomyces oligophaga]|uniref:uncharacterized protein n=1 Tax=Lipomyces oligophaga TaxID=45792 RepID=UPI0034CF9D43
MFFCSQRPLHNAAAAPFSTNPYAAHCSQYVYGDYNIYNSDPSSSSSSSPSSSSMMMLDSPADFGSTQPQHAFSPFSNAERVPSFSRKRGFADSFADEAFQDHACSTDLPTPFRPVASIKKRSTKPLETHVQVSTVRRLFEAAQQPSAYGSPTMQVDDLSCEDCDNIIMIEEYTADPNSYSCFACNRTVCWRCSLRSQETNNALECLQCASSRVCFSSAILCFMARRLLYMHRQIFVAGSRLVTKNYLNRRQFELCVYWVTLNSGLFYNATARNRGGYISIVLLLLVGVCLFCRVT